MPTATILRFPARPILIPLRAFDVRFGAGEVVAMLFCVPVYDHQRQAGNGDQEGRDDQAVGAVGAAE